jgi:hypothetical protein
LNNNIYVGLLTGLYIYILPQIAVSVVHQPTKSIIKSLNSGGNGKIWAAKDLATVEDSP